MTFDEVIRTDPPRLVVTFMRGDDGSEKFQWGVVGDVPILTMLGHLARVQADLLGKTFIPSCGQRQGVLVIVWDAEQRALTHYADPDIPRTPLAGMLEVIKGVLVGSMEGQRRGSEKVQLYRADGVPYQPGA